MTTLARATPPAGPHAVPACALRVRWVVARAALHRARPDLVPSGAGPPVVLEWRVERAQTGRLLGAALVVDCERAVPVLSLTGAAGAWVRDGLDHIDIPGLLSVSLRLAPGVGRVLFARTTILAEWGVPGGRYQVAPHASGGRRDDSSSES